MMALPNHYPVKCGGLLPLWLSKALPVCGRNDGNKGCKLNRANPAVLCSCMCLSSWLEARCFTTVAWLTLNHDMPWIKVIMMGERDKISGEDGAQDS